MHLQKHCIITSIQFTQVVWYSSSASNISIIYQFPSYFLRWSRHRLKQPEPGKYHQHHQQTAFSSVTTFAIANFNHTFTLCLRFALSSFSSYVYPSPTKCLVCSHQPIASDDDLCGQARTLNTRVRIITDGLVWLVFKLPSVHFRRVSEVSFKGLERLDQINFVKPNLLAWQFCAASALQPRTLLLDKYKGLIRTKP